MAVVRFPPRNLQDNVIRQRTTGHRKLPAVAKKTGRTEVDL